MRDIPAELIIESVDAGVGAFIDLFEADLQPYGGGVVRFHSGTNGYYGDVIWRGLAYWWHQHRRHDSGSMGYCSCLLRPDVVAVQ